MRRFRFVGDPKEYNRWNKRPVFNDIYDQEKHAEYYGSGANSAWRILDDHEDWQEVFDEPKPLHKDTDLGMFTLGIINGTISNQLMVDSMSDQSRQFLVENAILLAKELIKQLDSLHDTAPNHNE